MNTAALALPPGELHQLFIQIRRTMSYLEGRVKRQQSAPPLDSTSTSTAAPRCEVCGQGSSHRDEVLLFITSAGAQMLHRRCHDECVEGGGECAHKGDTAN